MKEKILIILIGLFAGFFTIHAQDNAPLKSLRLLVWDGVYNASINHETGEVTVAHIAKGTQVTGVEFALTENATISPNPKSLVGKWPEQTTFTVKANGKKNQYVVKLTDYVEVPAPLSADGKDIWKTIWAEEFNSNTLDTLVWSKTPRNRSDWNNTMTDDERLYEFRDGALILKGINNTINESDSSKFLTGGVWGRDKRSFALGRVDVRGKFASAKGYWPAIWLLPQGGNSPYSKEGEIDMVERLNFDEYVYMTLHTEYTNLVNKENPKNHLRAPVDPEEYNIYSVEIYQDKLVYLVNNKAVFTYPKLKPHVDNQFPFASHDYYIILSSQLGGSWVGEVNPDDLPVEMAVDWVRVYQTK